VAAGFRLPHPAGFLRLCFRVPLAFLIAMAAVLLQSLRAICDNPVNSLRSE
jgi:hypothetical protein